MKKQSNKLGFWLSTSLVVGNMTGSGIFLLPASLALYGGISIFGWLLTLLGSVFLALVFSRLSRIIKKTGGPYAYAKEGFGDFTGFMVAWGYWISIWCGNAAIAVAGVGYMSVFIPWLKNEPGISATIAVAVIWLFTYINTLNIRKVGGVQLITTILKVLPLILLGTFGLLFINTDYFSPFNNSGQSNIGAVTSTAALTLWAFMGLESATVPSDKVKNPNKTIPKATIAGLLIAALMYISSSVAIMGIVSPDELRVSASPFADAAMLAWGKWAYYLVAGGAVISCFGALNGWILLQGQISMAASTDRLFPILFGKVNLAGMPVSGIIIGSVLASVLTALNFSGGLVRMFTFIIMLSTLTCLLPYLFTSLSEVMLYIRRKRQTSRKGIIIAGLIAFPAFIYTIWAISGLGLEVITWGFCLLAAGIPIYIYLKSVKQK